MTLENLNKEVENFIEVSYKMTADYKKEEADATKELNEGLRGSVEVEQTLENRMKENQKHLNDKAKELKERLEKVRDKEIEIINKSVEPITADNLAELELLSQLDLSEEDIKEYADKYKHTPLALRKLKSVAAKKNSMMEFPLDRKEQLDAILGKVDGSINKFKNPTYKKYDTQNKMIADSTISGIIEEVSRYRSL